LYKRGKGAVKLHLLNPGGLHVMPMSVDPAASLVARANDWSFTAKPFAIPDLLNRIKAVLALDVSMSVGQNPL
jgi:hypothetical protein